jgi:hypothetical protein
MHRREKKKEEEEEEEEEKMHQFCARRGVCGVPFKDELGIRRWCPLWADPRSHDRRPVILCGCFKPISLHSEKPM